MLSERDRRVLAGIEQGLTADSPALGRRLRRLSTSRVWALPVTAAVVGVATAVTLAALGLPGDAFVLLVLCAWPLARRLHRGRPVIRAWTRLRRRPRPGGRGRGPATTGV